MSLMLRVKYAQLALQGPDSAKQAELNLIWTEPNLEPRIEKRTCKNLAYTRNTLSLVQ